MTKVKRDSLEEIDQAELAEVARLELFVYRVIDCCSRLERELSPLDNTAGKGNITDDAGQLDGLGA